MQKNLKTALCATILLSAVACTPVTAQRGNLLQDYQVQEVKEGEHTRSDVLRLLGSPTTQSTFNTDVWYYIGQETEKRGILDSDVKNERIVAVSFDKDGVVQTIQNVDNERNNIPYARTKTPTHGNELTFTQQLLGNLGRFNTPQE
ncbi:MAG: outer membrane protein assembly factor BamE [Alphaproteobacteria bacterium]